MVLSWFQKNQLKPGSGAASSRRLSSGAHIAMPSWVQAIRRWIMCALSQQVARQSLGIWWRAAPDATVTRGLGRGGNGLGLSRFGQPNVRPGLSAGSPEPPVVSVHCLLIVNLSLPLLPVLSRDTGKRYSPDRASRGLNLLHRWGCASYHW